jgi:crotonobetainyl-CoA:carnitine CoA-transferase CaiB-like acyl-CoA transferase
MGSPLEGARVVSLAVNLPGPVAAAALRDVGASVVKVEPPGGDPLASVSPKWYADLTRGMQVQTLDLKAAADRRRLDDWLEAADLFLTSTRPAALQRLNLAWTNLHQRYPRLCQVAIVGYGSPRENVAGHDLTYQAEIGLVTPPALPPTLLADLGGAQQAVIAALALIMARDRDGEGSYVEVSLAGAARFFAEPLAYGLTGDGNALGGGLPAYGLYRTRDGWLAVAALEPRFRETLGRELSINPEDREALARVFAERSSAEWETWAEARDLPITGVRLPAGSSSGR